MIEMTKSIFIKEEPEEVVMMMMTTVITINEPLQVTKSKGSAAAVTDSPWA